MPHSHIPIMFNFILDVCTIFSHDVPAGVSAPPLNTTTRAAHEMGSWLTYMK